METDSKALATALLVMDIQTMTMQRLGDGAETPIAAINRAIAAARAAGIPVIYVVVGFRKGFPEIGPSNKSFSVIRQAGAIPGLEDPVIVDPAVKPQPGDIVVTKRRVSAFAGSDLEVILRARRIEHLVLSGFATSGVVLSTLREAADKDYRLSVLSDACADLDEEVHTVLMNKVFPRQAEVMKAAEWATGVGK
ncbi:MAG TPA: isochorismatase family cysteine hydrolase [Puia sp.]|jgi:nicotinamidase-related amidase|nr:isochorismatase family cysteine hydrolase [Puia sp.]